MPADPAAYARLLEDLAAEHGDLDTVVAALDDEAWDRPTPAAGWAIRDAVAHLAFFDARAREAAGDPPEFVAMLAGLRAAPGGEQRWMDHHLDGGRAMPPGDLLAWWRTQRDALLAQLAVIDPRARIPWFGPPMSTASFATARLMETWAHGQDVVDTLGIVRPPTPRLRHVAHIGVGALPYSFAVRGLDVPPEPVRVELDGPDHDVWAWGPPEAADAVRGPALDFCLVVTQRRNVADVALEVTGPVARRWITIAQAFAGGPGAGRGPGEYLVA